VMAMVGIVGILIGRTPTAEPAGLSWIELSEWVRPEADPPED
jgi:hypothetical protein